MCKPSQEQRSTYTVLYSTQHLDRLFLGYVGPLVFLHGTFDNTRFLELVILIVLGVALGFTPFNSNLSKLH